MSTLYIVATPIGNLEDITLRALRILKEVDCILAEDTRVTAKLLARYEIKKPLMEYQQHSDLHRVRAIIDQLVAGQTIALVTDAGTPGISDPGGQLVQAIVESGQHIQIVPIPGPNAAITALSVSGFPTDRFLFLGFPPNKKGRKTFFEEVAKAEVTVVFYESPFRIAKAIAELPPDRQVMIARELTKKFETIYRGRASEVQLDPTEIKGEFVVVVRSL